MLLRDEFLLDNDVIFLNHGFAGACPRYVLDIQQTWKEHLEKNPPRFIRTELPRHMESARQALAQYLRIPPRNLLFIPSVTFGINLVAQSLKLLPNDEILTTNHEFPVSLIVLESIAAKQRAILKKHRIALPQVQDTDVAGELWESATRRTKAIFLSHITSSTALTLPIRAVCHEARERGITTVIDGAHGPSLIPLDLSDIGADFYIGACYKWLCAPKGSSFLYASDTAQKLLEPLVIGWGQSPNGKNSISLSSLYEEIGTRDPSAFLAVPAAIEYQDRNNWPAARRRCRDMTEETIRQLTSIKGVTSCYLDSSNTLQMGVVRLPDKILREAQQQLYNIYRIEVPVIRWEGMDLLRLSVQVYNTKEDLDLLVSAIKNLTNECN